MPPAPAKHARGSDKGRAPPPVDVRVVTLRGEVPGPICTVFPEAKAFRATDLRGVSADELYARGLVTLGAAHVLKRGRKWHHELSSSGCVGLAQSVLGVLRECARDRSTLGERWLLLCEEDCDPSTHLPERIADAVRDPALRGCDAVMFGPVHMAGGFEERHRTKGLVLAAPANHTAVAWGTHCVLFSPRGMRRWERALAQPLEMQIDALMVQRAISGEFELLVETAPGSARQQVHASYLQSQCHLCDVSPHSPLLRFSSGLYYFTCVAVILALYFAYKHRECVAGSREPPE